MGQFCERKNQIEVMKAFHMAIKEGVKGKLIFLGHTDMPYADECARYAADNGLQESVENSFFSPLLQQSWHNMTLFQDIGSKDPHKRQNHIYDNAGK